MSTWLARCALVAAIVCVGAAAGWLFGRALNAPMPSAWFGAAFGLAAAVLVDTWRGRQVADWLRSDAAGAAPTEAGIWGDIAAQIERALKRRELDARQQRQRLSDFLEAIEASPNGVLLLDANHQIAWCSRVAADHLGLQPQRDLRQHVTNLVRSPEFVEQLTGAASDRPVSFVSPTGVRVSSLIRHYGDGFKLVLTQDVTERERTEAMRRNFVANVSHEIRTPLTVLAGFVDTMMQLPLSEAERQRVLALMAAQAKRMQALVADLLTLARLEGSPRPAADDWIDVRELLQRAQADARSLSDGRHELHFDGGDDAQIAGSEAELFSALTNLVVNAVRYTAPGGRIEVSWQWLDEEAGALVVSDTGIGIAREHLLRLSERFYRVDGSRSRDTGGTGLGLSIVKHVAQRHGGDIDMHSEPGVGSIFRVRLPASRLRQRPRALAERAPTGRH